MTTYEEWRVTGTWTNAPYTAIWSGTTYDQPETEARSFVAQVNHSGWTDGPHLHKRTVTVTDWEEA